MSISKFTHGYIQFVRVNNTTRIHIHFRKLIPNTKYSFYIVGFFMYYELCNLKSNYKGELNYIFYDTLQLHGCKSILGKKINMYENNSKIEYAIIV
jgi:hypothetical protein